MNQTNAQTIRTEHDRLPAGAFASHPGPLIFYASERSINEHHELKQNTERGEADEGDKTQEGNTSTHAASEPKQPLATVLDNTFR